MSIKLSIIIVNWNGEKFLPACLASIAENPPNASFEIIVVDNDSKDKSVEWLKSPEARQILKNTNFRLIESGENLGFGRANNLAIEQSDTPFLFLLNPDTVVKAQAIDKLLETLQSNDKIGMTAPKLFQEDGSIQGSVWAFPVTATYFLVRDLKLYKFLSKKFYGNWLLSIHWSYDERRSVPMVSGAAMMVKREMINSVGGFNPKLFMYGEDAEWCIRIRRKNWLIYFEPNAEIMHIGGESTKQLWNKIEKTIKEEEAFLRFQQEFLSPFQVMRNTAARLFITQTLKIKNQLQKKNVDFLDKLKALQYKGFQQSLRDLLKNNRSSS